MAGLKPEIAFEVRKDNAMNFEEAAKCALRIEAAMRGSTHRTLIESAGDSPTPMELGNFEMRSSRVKKRLTDDEYSLVKSKRCFICKTRGCRSWKHTTKEKNPKVSAVQVEVDGEDSSDSGEESEN